MEEAALIFTASSKSHKEIESAGKKAMPIIFKGETNHSLYSLRHRQQEVITAKSFVKPGTLSNQL